MFSTYPIHEIKTTDGLNLSGILVDADSTKNTLFLFIHGTASNFYCEDFIPELSHHFIENNISFLLANNRGAGIGESWQKSGAAVEKFEDCVIDIDAWIDFAATKGYEKIVLCGHSLGSEKVVYYMNKGKNISKVNAVILLGFSDSYGYHYNFLKSQSVDPMIEALELVKSGKGYQYLTSIWLSHAGALPQSAESYINFFSENSELSKALPIRNGKKLEFYRNIKIPILAVISDGREFTVIPTDEAIKLLQTENENIEIHKLHNCQHSFQGAEKQLSRLIVDFIQKLSVKA